MTNKYDFSKVGLSGYVPKPWTAAIEANRRKTKTGGKNGKGNDFQLQNKRK